MPLRSRLGTLVPPWILKNKGGRKNAKEIQTFGVPWIFVAGTVQGTVGY